MEAISLGYEKNSIKYIECLSQCLSYKRSVNVSCIITLIRSFYLWISTQGTNKSREVLSALKGSNLKPSGSSGLARQQKAE